MVNCEIINNRLAEFSFCVETNLGHKLTTHVMYPSFEPVSVFVVSRGDQFEVHDGGGAVKSAATHAIDGRSVKSACQQSAMRFSCEFFDDHISASAIDQDWLYSAIDAVANASSLAAHNIIQKKSVQKKQSLITKTKKIFDDSTWGAETKTEISIPGKSGKLHNFDLAVIYGNKMAIIDAVVPHPNSIAAKYLAFSDAAPKHGTYKYAIYEDDMSNEDKVLIANVADLISFSALQGTNGKFLLN